MPRRKLWSERGNPPKSVADALGMERWQLRDRLHVIKRAADLGGADNVVIWDDGAVTDAYGEEIGNVRDED